MGSGFIGGHKSNYGAVSRAPGRGAASAPTSTHETMVSGHGDPAVSKKVTSSRPAVTRSFHQDVFEPTPRSPARASATRTSSEPARKQASRTAAMSNSQLGQRERALEVLRHAPPGSVGAAIRPMMEELIRRAGEMASGSLGEFYERNRGLLYRPATDKNIDKFARRETRHFRSERDWFAWGAGLVLSERDRAQLIKGCRDALLGTGPGPRLPFNLLEGVCVPAQVGSRFGFGQHGMPMGSLGSQGGGSTLGIGTIGLRSFGPGGFNTGLSTSSIGVGTIGSSGLSSFGLGGFNTGPSTISGGSLGSGGGSLSTGGFNGSGR